MSLKDKHILLIISGGVAAYKSLDLIRKLKDRGASVTPIMTKAAQEFITPLAVGALSGGHVYSDLFSRTDEQDIGHIRLAREHDLIIIAPATANLMAKTANGLADDLASTVVLARDCPMLIAPAMNPKMWSSPTTQRNFKTLKTDGAIIIGPKDGEMAESGEAGMGRMAEPLEIIAAVEAFLNESPKPLAGKHVIVTSGPTREAIDPVRYIANHSSGRQGHALAEALAKLGADVTLVSGPVNIADPVGVKTIHIESAREMLTAVETALPAEIAIMVAAVSDWRAAEPTDQKIKKRPGETRAPLSLVENPDILKTIGHHQNRPHIVIGFAAETNNVIAYASDKLIRKGADLIVANDVSIEGIMGGSDNQVTLVTKDGTERWPRMNKTAVAERLAVWISDRC